MFVWDASVLEGNPFTFVEVKTLLDGVTVGGHKVSDQQQVRHPDSAGIDAISIPAAKAQAFNEKMVSFYLSKDATEMMDFSLNAIQKQRKIRRANEMKCSTLMISR